jgi:hypothetical protein
MTWLTPGRIKMRCPDITGKRFSYLTVLERSPKKPKSGGYSLWECQCACGNKSTVRGSNLRMGRTVSCGCFNAQSKIVHGHTYHYLRGTWSTIKYRCCNPKAKQWPDYGGRGITLHPAWQDLPTFVADILAEIGHRPNGKTLDRINNDDGYKPGNIRWATSREQNQNKRNSTSGHHIPVFALSLPG